MIISLINDRLSNYDIFVYQFRQYNLYPSKIIGFGFNYPFSRSNCNNLVERASSEMHGSLAIRV